MALPPSINAQEAAAFVGSLNQQQVKMLFATMAERVQKDSNDVNVLSYQNAKNGKKIDELAESTSCPSGIHPTKS
jgi:hypothetical protein